MLKNCVFFGKNVKNRLSVGGFVLEPPFASSPPDLRVVTPRLVLQLCQVHF